MFSFFKFIFWVQFLLLQDAIQGLWSNKFHCLEIEEKLVYCLGVQCINVSEPERNALEKNTKIVLINHRSYADFFIDSYLCGGAANLGRYMVLLALPIAGLYGIWTGRVLFFNRGRTNRSALTQKILNHLNKYQKPLIVYPEGRRYLGSEPIALRHGVLKTCFENKLQCQILIGWGKEFILNEKIKKIQSNQICTYAISHIIQPADFNTYEAFYAHITETWAQSWQKTQEQWHKKDLLPQDESIENS